MIDKEFEKMMEEKRKDAATPGYGKRCQEQRKAEGSGEYKKGNPYELILS